MAHHGTPKNPAVKALMPFDMAAVDAVVAGGAKDASNPVFKKGTVQNDAARVQNQWDKADAIAGAHGPTHHAQQDAAKKKYTDRLNVLGGPGPMAGPSGDASHI